MARFLVKASEFKNVCKAVNDRQLESLKKEIIEILKKQDDKEFKKAIDYLEAQELHYTHLEKSINGKWIQKAGYGVGTIRIWKGKKYKKIAPGKWARVFDKEGRGTNIAIGKLIAKVQKIDNVEDLMAFVMANKQRFVDENGIDLPVLDKLRAAVDARNGSVGSNGISKPSEKENNSYDNMSDKEINAEVSKELDNLAAKSKKPTIHEAANYIKENNKELYNNLEKRWGDSLISALADVAIERKNAKDKKESAAEKDPETKEKLSDDAEIVLLNLKDWNKDEAQSILSKKINNSNNDKNMDAYKEAYDYLNTHDMPSFKDGKIVEKESEAEKHQNRSDAMKGNKNAYKGGVTNNPDKLKPIAKAEKIEDGKVKLPYSKEVADEIKQLTNTSKDAVKKGSRYDFLTKLYYDKGNLVSTDGNKLKIVKVGNLDGIENGTFVDIDNTKEGVTITADKDFTESHKFPLYERVIPQDNNEKIVLDNKALISKIKDLKKDGGITTKDSYVTFDIQGNDLMLDGVKVGDVSAANFEGENSDYINFDADILTSYLSGDKTELFSSKDSSKSMYFGNGSILNVIMPQVKTTSRYDSDGKEIKEQRRKDYNSMRKDKEVSDEIKTRSKALRKELNEGYVENIVNGYKRSVPANFEEKSIEKLKEWTTEQLQRMYKVANADIDSLMEKKDFNSNSFSSFCYKNFDMSPNYLIGQNYAMKEHPAIVREIERLIKEKGGKIEKSLFDDFVIDMFDYEEDEEEQDKEEESLFNDYSAEQPELFNSTEMMVNEAFNRCNCL